MIRLAFILLCALTSAAQARPVSYPGGWTIMQMNDAYENSLHLHYSPTAKHSIGYKGEYWRDTETQFHGVQLNTLLKRWNAKNSQANLYLKTAAGAAHSDASTFNGKTEPAAFAELAADWEDRRYFTSYKSRLTYAGDIDKQFMQRARIGIAPYIGDYGDLHTWLMLQLDHRPKQREALTVTPLIRFFKSETMLEAGLSNDGDVLFNTIIRF